MKRFAAFLMVCDELAAGLLGRKPRQPPRGISWELLVEASSYHRVTPALAWCLKDRTDIPDEVREYFAAILSLNAERNEVLRSALLRVVSACNAISIEPVPLKGAARLIEGTYPAQSLRFQGDIDVLIPADRAAQAFAAVRAIGFRESADNPPLPPGHNHLPMLHDQERGGGVELHTDVLTGTSGEIVDTAWFLAGTRACPLDGARIRLADATRSVAHIIAHDQLFHGGYTGNRAGKFDLRQLLDVALIRAHHDAAIDWQELDHRFSRAGFPQLLPTYLSFGEELFGQPAPRLGSPPRPRELREYQNIVEPSRLYNIGKILRGYAAARRRDPLGVMQLFVWYTWPRRIRLVKRALKLSPSSW